MTDGVRSGGGRHNSDFYALISPENLLRAWRRFSKGKRTDSEFARFELYLEENLFSLHEQLAFGVWTNDPYERQPIADPKPRIIHVPSVRDRVLFQVVYQELYQIFDNTFIHDSYASRERKGTHAGVKQFEVFARKVSTNYTNSAFVLKCDIRKFFDSIDHRILFSSISHRITDQNLLTLIHRIISSFEVAPNKGLPLGNVTSQIFANIYLNVLDQFVKHTLKAPYYIRYCDDFVILDKSRAALMWLIARIQMFLRDKLLLELHPRKVSLRKLRQGTDFLGYVSLPHYRVLRTRTRKRMLKRVNRINLPSYLGLLEHCKGFRTASKIKEMLYTRRNEKW
ncbi:MAG: reverse transcriptase domain-containing protein [bacterium]|nr:reverse transcriptase domain-containing protein [bacterium]